MASTASIAQPRSESIAGSRSMIGSGLDHQDRWLEANPFHEGGQRAAPGLGHLA
jgi:hypothetical protein